mgnify:CR=1 FL=1
MKSSNTALEVAGRFILGGAANQVSVTGKKSVTVADTYESFTVTKTLDALVGNIYDNINSLSFRIQLGAVSDYVIIDNVRTNYTINGVTLSVGDDELESFTVYPNPASTIVNIKGFNNLSKVQLYDVLGKKVFDANELTNNQINVESFNPGIYLLKLIDANTQFVIKKLIIK